MFHFFVALLLIIFSNCYRIKIFIIVLLFGRQIIFASIAPVIRFFLEMVSCYFKILKLPVILILIVIKLIFTLVAFFLLFVGIYVGVI